MSSIHDVRSTLEPRLRSIDTMPWQDRQVAYEEFAYEARDTTLKLASEGKFGEAFKIFHWIRSEADLEPENTTFWSDFRIGIAKAILVHGNSSRTIDALKDKDNQVHLPFLQKAVSQLSASDASDLQIILDLCRHDQQML